MNSNGFPFTDCETGKTWTKLSMIQWDSVKIQRNSVELSETQCKLGEKLETKFRPEHKLVWHESLLKV